MLDNLGGSDMSESPVEEEQNKPAEPEPRIETGPYGYRLKLRLENQQMECLADLEPIEQAPPPQSSTDKTKKTTTENNFPLSVDFPLPARLTPAELFDILKKNGVTRTIDFEALYLLCAAAEEGASQQGVLLAQGVESEAGADGWFEMAVKAPGEDPEFDEDEQGNVDLRTLHSHTEVEQGQKLGTVHPPQEGSAGITANDLPIPAERGKPFKLLAGDGVVIKYDGRVAFAEKAGRALLNKQTLSVVDELVISGDLDLNTGNIDFHGFVEIRGDVPDDFTIKASKGIQVAGAVGACQLEAGGPIEIGSMAGKEIGRIICQGDLTTSYLNQVSVACHGNVLVANEIRNSQVKATGRIVVERGSIIGGKALALEGIEAKILGATSCVRTHLVAGRYFPDADRFDYLHQRLQEINHQVKAIHEALGPLERIKELSEALGSSSERRLTILNEQWEKLEVEKEQVEAELRASSQQTFGSCNPKVNALTTINEGVIVCLGQSSERFNSKISGPVSLIENTRQGGLRHLGLSPLSTSAALIEDAMLLEERCREEQQATESEKN
jgi:uncharacterized protein (DUF342 family)